SSQSGRRTTKELLEDLVEAAHTPKAGSEGDLGHRQLGLGAQLFLEKRSSGLSHTRGRGTNMSLEQPAKLATAQTEPFSKRVDVCFRAVELTLDNERNA